MSGFRVMHQQTRQMVIAMAKIAIEQSSAPPKQKRGSIIGRAGSVLFVVFLTGGIMSDETRQVEFIVLGSSGTHYKVTFYKKNDIFYSNCNCSAGVNGASCKHRLNILIGDITSVVSPKKEDFEFLTELLQGTHVGKALYDLNNFNQPKFTIDKIHPASPNEESVNIAFFVRLGVKNDSFFYAEVKFNCCHCYAPSVNVTPGVPL